MKTEMVTIGWEHLAMLLPLVLVVIGILWRWGVESANAPYAIARMLVQLTLIGYLLIFIFSARSGWIVIGVLGVMLAFATWIALRTVPGRRRKLLSLGILSIALGGGTTLVVVTQGVLGLDPWYRADYMIPLAGMVFANAMNSVSLAAERYDAERREGSAPFAARNAAMHSALIPVLNALFAVGLVSLPGMMTGQILSGVSPLIAVRYQIMVMLMVFSAAGFSAVLFLWGLTRRDLHRSRRP
ncbi:ABC transporter permease [Nitratifractor sp.]